MMVKWRCRVCGTEGWSRGWEEPDVNAAGVCEDDPMEGACQHILDGGDYDLIDQSYDDGD
jgi:hypothetical protein